MAGKFSISAVLKADDQMSAVIAKAEGGLGRFARSVSGGLGKVQAVNDRIVTGFTDVAAKAAMVGAAFLGLAGAGIYEVMKSSNAVVDQTARIETVLPHMAGTVVQSSAEMEKAALDWSSVHKTTAEDFLKSSYMMISAGLNEEQSLAGSRTASLVAAATFGDAGAAAEALATQYNVLGDKSKDVNVEMGHLGDVMTRTQQVFQFKDLAQVTDGLKYATPTAKMFGQSLEELNTVMGMLNNSGIVGTSAGTAYSAMMEKMIPASKALGFAIAHTKDGTLDFGGTLANIHKKFGSFDKASDTTKAKLEEAFGRRGIVGIALLADQADKFASNLAQVRDNAGAAATAAATIEAAGSGPIDILINKFTNLKVSMGEALTPTTGPIIASIGRVADAVAKWTTANQALIAANIKDFIGGIIDALPRIIVWVERVARGIGVLFGFYFAVKAVSGVMALVTAQPWMLVLYALVLLAAAVAAFWPDIVKHKDAIEGVATVLGAVVLAYKGTAMWTGIVQGAMWLMTTAQKAYAFATQASTVATIGLDAGLLPLLLTIGAILLAVGAMIAVWHNFNKLLDETGGWKGLGAFATGGFKGLDKEMDRKAKDRANDPTQAAGGDPSMTTPPGGSIQDLIKTITDAAKAPATGAPPVPGIPSTYGPPPPPGMPALPGMPAFPGPNMSQLFGQPAPVSVSSAKDTGEALASSMGPVLTEALKKGKGEITITVNGRGIPEANVSKQPDAGFSLNVASSGGF